MTYEEKKTLVILLNKYKTELLKQDTQNRKERDYHVRWDGTKAQLNHCRCIKNKLMADMFGGIG